MKKRLLKVSSPYRQYLSWYEKRNADCLGLPYDDQVARLLKDGFGWGNLWTRHLEGSGKYEVHEIISSSDRLQQLWLAENGRQGKRASSTEILLLQIEHYAPEILFLHSTAALKEVAALVKRRFGDRIKIVGYDGVEEHSQAAYTATDLMLVPVSEYAARYRAAGVRAEVMPYGFDEQMVGELNQRKKDINVCFIGGAYLTSGHFRRIKVLNAVRRAVACDYWITGLPTEARFWQWIVRAGLRRDWSRLRQQWSLHAEVRSLREATRGEVYGRAMFDLLARSKVALNCHIDIAGGLAGNMRLYESAGLGACLLTDWKENIQSLYEPDREIVVYKTPEEAVALARELVDAPQVAAKIGEAAQARTLRDYAYGKIFQQVGELLYSL